jgi:CO dehydrogenase nickel-insertion accessory protein CooC1
LVIVEQSAKSALTARRLATILRSDSGVAVLPVANKVDGPNERRWLESVLGEPIVGSIPADRLLADAERAGLAPIDHAPASPAMRAIEALADLLETTSAPRAARRAA